MRLFLWCFHHHMRKIFKWSCVLTNGGVTIPIFVSFLMMQRLTVTLWTVLNSSTSENRHHEYSDLSKNENFRWDKWSILNQWFWQSITTCELLIWKWFFFICNWTDCWNTCSSSSISKITLMNIVRLTICSLNMIWTSGACLDVRFNDGTQVFLSSRRQGIPMTSI